MRAIDTNVLVRLIVRDDPAQVDAAERFIEQGAWVSTVALLESAWVLAGIYNFTPRNLATAIEMLLEHKTLALQDPQAVAQAVQLFRSKPKLGFSDCLMLELARSAGHLPMGTFDRNLSKVEGAQKPA